MREPPRWVYPRVGGGTQPTLPVLHAPDGLSPRGRGNHPATPGRNHIRRSIPAWAGEPSQSKTFSMRRWVYPRVGGGTQPTLPVLHAPDGLSPRGRGNRHNQKRFQCADGSIPAWAGMSKERIFETRFNLRTGRPRKPTISKPRKKATTKRQKPKPRTQMTTAQVAAQREERREYDRQRSTTPERRESRRLQAQEQRRKAKELGLCRDCPNPAKPGRTRCEPCAAKHRESRRRSDAKRR